MKKIIVNIYNFIIKLIGKEMFMYLLFGFLTTLINFIVYYICNIPFHMKAGVSTTLAFIAGVIFAYITNKLWVFASKTNKFKDLIIEIFKFISARIITYIIDLVLMIILVDKLNYNSLICKLLVNILVIILNYIFSKLLVFNKSNNKLINSFKDKYLYVVYIIYVVFMFILILKHEPWRDEAQSFLIVRDLNIKEIFNILKYEGHPLLYYLVIYISKYLGYKTVNIISYILGMISAYLILFKSKINKYLSILFIFSMPFIYYSIFGRSYSLILLLMTIISIIYKDKENKLIFTSIIVFLLTNTHILLFGFCLSLFFIELYEYFILKNKNKKKLMGILIELLGFLILILQLIGSNSSLTNISIISIISSFGGIFRVLCNGLNILMGLILMFLFLTLFIYLFIKNKKMFFILLMSIGFLSCMDAFIYNLLNYHCFLIFLFLYFILTNYDKKLMKIFFIFSLLIIFGLFTNYITKEYLYDYSDSYNVSNYLKKEIPNGGKILCTYDDLCSGIIPYLDNNYKFIALNGDREYTYTLRDDKRNYSFLISFDKYLYQDKIDYIIYPYLVNDIFTNNFNKFVDSNILEIVYQSSNAVLTDEKYIIYKVVK